jgi:hypothetical protein
MLLILEIEMILDYVAQSDGAETRGLHIDNSMSKAFMDGD